MATYNKILESLNLSEEKPKNAGPGDTWQTKSGNWVGMKQGKKGEKNPTQSYGQEGKKKAKAYASGGDPDKVDDGEKDEPEKEPEKETTPEKEPEAPEQKNIDTVKARIEKLGDKLPPEDVKKVNDLVSQVDKLKDLTGDKKQELAKKLMDTYKLGMSSNGKKFYIKSIGEYKAMGSGKASAELIDVFKGVEGFGELDQFKAAKNKLQTASKPELATASKPGDTNVDKIFVGDETLNRLPEKYRGVFAPMGKDGKILHPSSAHSGEYFKQSVNENTALDSTIEALKGEEKAGTISPNMRVALEGHKERMVEMRDKFDSIKDPKERASEVAKSYATLFQQMHKADSDMGGSMIKNMAEMALYDTEIAAEQEAYLPSAGTFPSGDKLRVDRGGKGKVEKVASVSVKYGKSGQFYGFPGQTDKYANYHPDPDYRNRQANRAGRKGYETGIRDDLIDDPKKFQKMVDESGYGEAIKNPKEVQAIAKEMQDYFREIKKTKGITSETSITLKTIEKDVYSKNAELMKKMDKVMDWDKFESLSGRSDVNLCRSPKHGVLALTNMMSFMSIVKTSGGLQSIEHNHQEIHDGKYVSRTDTGTDDSKDWNFGFRPFGGRAGGLIAGFSKEEQPEDVDNVLEPQNEPETKKEQYESLEGTISRIVR